MCRELDALRQSVCDYAQAFDAGSLIPARAASVVQACAAIEASIGAVKVLAAAVVEAGGSWKGQGYRSAEEQLADWTGTGTSSAKKSLDAGRRMAQNPEVADAALGGRLSPEQASLVADGAAANHSKTRELIDRAHDTSVGELRNEVAQVKAESTDLEERRRRIHAARSLRRYRDADGVWHVFASGNVEDGIELARLLEPIRQRLHRTRLNRGEPRQTFEQLDYDALVLLTQIARGTDGELSLADLVELGLFSQIKSIAPPASPPPDEADPKPAPTRRLAGRSTQLNIRVDLAALLRGVPLEGELCDIPGYGPVPVSVIRELVASGNVVVAGLLTKGEQIIGVRHFGRRPTRAQQTALDFIYPECAALGCNRSTGLEYDHRVDWSKTHFTVYDLIDRLCWYHHQQKTRLGWALVAGQGKRPFVAPTDPRHPSRASTRGDPPPPRRRTDLSPATATLAPAPPPRAGPAPPSGP